MSRHEFKVFSEGKIASLVLKNRLVRSATGESKMSSDGKMEPSILQVYQDLAKGGVGLIVTGAMAATPTAKRTEGQACIYDDSFIPEIAQIADIVHRTDPHCKVIAQLNHPGRQVHHYVSADCIAPSEVESPILLKKARELHLEEIERIILYFADAIVRVQKAGFDGVQFHAAHGYLLSSFLSPYTNRRTDRYGGSAENRVNIIRDIISKARQEVGDFPILIKMNADDHVKGGICKENLHELLYEMEKTGVDAIEISGGMWDCLVRTEEELGFPVVPIPEARTKINKPEKESYYYDYVKEIKLSIPLLLVGGHRQIDRMEAILQEGNVDFLSLCRPLISEPNLPNRWLHGEGKEKADCISCNACLLVLHKEFCCPYKKYGNLKDLFIATNAENWREMFK
ncbi:2,4-dienoyl-CoA reductase-like NADH-dependent reductase (Old Yellow Enzyme family) [Paenibacillus shirakamiensis]|uniref:2,4-dienoyl-CoA reductase-like NADH-dependent reductase (Old Yellow Enzyme family) n=1 Tax=Paenibacillus shirakamiensis TaxID=1265935 RepID=A0ABS4JEP5_9BACL|nr:NADH:flavin oxidoreductase [Paenibacillus shirakamiensis]MBP2000168.1 2,4-dienoyl-CoA reductase-like NADH-dependent reductase (Old Yellow Enzyme family) [Paenibacillus shirakamiensis]